MNHPDLQQRVLDAATRPFDGNAELKAVAVKWLEDNAVPDPEKQQAAVARWDAADARPGRRVWPWLILATALLVSIILWTRHGQEIHQHFLWAKAGAQGFFQSPQGREGRVLGYLGPKQRLLVPLMNEDYGTSAQKLWEMEPGNAAYFSEHALMYSSRNQRLPPDFMATARKLEPDNAWFLYLAAAVDARESVERLSNATWKVTDQARMDSALALAHEAGTLKQFNPHAVTMLRERLGTLRHGTFPERMDTVHVLYSTRFGLTEFLDYLASVMAAKAVIATEAGDVDSYRQISRDADAFIHHILRAEVGTRRCEVMNRSQVNLLSSQLAWCADKMALLDEYYRWNDISNQVTERQDPTVRSQEGRRRRPDPSSFPLLYHLVSNSSVNAPPPDAERLEPMKFMEQSELALSCASASWAAMVVAAAVMACYQLRLSRLQRGLAGREVDLLDWRDGWWIAGAGVLLPLLYVVAINRLTPVGGRHLILAATGFLLPTAHFAGLVLLWLTVTPQIVRWRLVKRAGAMGFPAPRWPGRFASLASVAAIAFIPAIGWAAISNSHPGWWEKCLQKMGLPFTPSEALPDLFLATNGLFLLALGITLTRAIAALWTRPANQRHAGASAKVLARAYTGTVILMALATWACKAEAQYWFDRDTLSKTSVSTPGFCAYDHELAIQMRNYFREAIGDHP